MTIRPRISLAVFASAALIGLMIMPATAASASPRHWPWQAPYNCTGGKIPPGVYQSIVVTGVCYMPVGNIYVRGDVAVAPGALLDAVKAGDPAGTPVVPATVWIGGNVYVGWGAAFFFGCSPNITCQNPPGITYDHIEGSLFAFGAQGVVLHSASIAGSAYIYGGGGGTAGLTCEAQKPGKPLNKALEPWSEDPTMYHTPVYTDVEDASVGGNLSITRVSSCWLGSLRNQVRGNVTIVGNKMGDPDAMEVDNNLVSGNMYCFDNSPAVQFGDGMSAPNLVGGYGAGECGFNVTQPSPAPAGKAGPGISEHIAVSTWSLRTYWDTYTSHTVASLPAVTTSSGDRLLAELKDFRITGSGLTGSGTVNLKAKPGTTGEAELITVYPNGWQQFTAYDTCSPCRLDGQTGTITLRLYGITAPWGGTWGTFLVTSGGGPAPGSLRTLAGWGTFSSYGRSAGTLCFVEHVAIT